MKKTVIATVGTSLLRGLQKKEIDWNLPAEEINQRICQLENPVDICAEISSVHSLINEGIVDIKENLYLLNSDTAEGKKIGQILKGCFSPVFGHVHGITVEKLNGRNAGQFVGEGLRNFVKTFIQIVEDVPGKEEECIINATGGYKAQISFAGLIGQLLTIPVYYQFEGFSSIVQLPPVPVTFDNHFWAKYFDFLEELYESDSVPSDRISNIDLRALEGLIEEVDGHFRLSAAGLLFHEVLRKR